MSRRQQEGGSSYLSRHYSPSFLSSFFYYIFKTHQRLSLLPLSLFLFPVSSSAYHRLPSFLQPFNLSSRSYQRPSPLPLSLVLFPSSLFLFILAFINVFLIVYILFIYHLGLINGPPRLNPSITLVGSLSLLPFPITCFLSFSSASALSQQWTDMRESNHSHPLQRYSFVVMTACERLHLFPASFCNTAEKVCQVAPPRLNGHRYPRHRPE